MKTKIIGHRPGHEPPRKLTFLRYFAYISGALLALAIALAAVAVLVENIKAILEK
jgi:hypothetical protein